MADEDKKTALEETKWWIDRGPAKEKNKSEQPQSIVEQWALRMLHGYNQDQAVRNVVDINKQLQKEFTEPAGGWKYLSLGVGNYPAGGLARIKDALRLPPHARALIIDAGYSVRVLITAEPVGERLMDVNFTEGPSFDFWMNGELAEERLFRNVDEALKNLRGSVERYLKAPARG
jgi:hypothetical protein